MLLFIFLLTGLHKLRTQTTVCPFAANLRHNYMQELKPAFFSDLYLIPSYLGKGKLIFCCMARQTLIFGKSK